MSPLRYQKWLRLNEVRRPMLNEHYDVTTAAYAVGYESYPISVGNIRGCLESHPREIIQIELRDDQDAALKNGDSKTVIVDEITRNAQFPLKARAITVNGNASQGTIEALINVIYTWQ